MVELEPEIEQKKNKNRAEIEQKKNGKRTEIEPETEKKHSSTFQKPSDRRSQRSGTCISNTDSFQDGVSGQSVGQTATKRLKTVPDLVLDVI